MLGTAKVFPKRKKLLLPLEKKLFDVICHTAGGYLLETLPDPVRVDEMALTMLDNILLLTLCEALTLAEGVLEVAVTALDEDILLDDDAPVLPAQPANSNKLIIVAILPNVIKNLFFI